MSYNPDHPADHLTDAERIEVERQQREFVWNRERPSSPGDHRPAVPINLREVL